MNYETLYTTSVVNNNLAWNAAVSPTEDTLTVSDSMCVQFEKNLQEFIKDNPDSPISHFNLPSVENDELLVKYINKKTELFSKYTELRKDKLPGDDEYFDLFDEVVSLTKDIMKEKNIDAKNLHWLSDDHKLASAEDIFSLVEFMVDVSKKFIQNGRTGTPSPVTVNRDDYTALANELPDVYLLESNANGSFMMGIDKDNARIHIKDKDRDFEYASSTSHEIGHALYQTRLLNQYTDVGPIGGCISLSLHESSSIFTEINLAGIESEVNPADKKNLFRLGADKLHYVFHLYIRMLIEKELFEDKIKARDIPERWNGLVEEYIGQVPSNDWEGFLQDVHWNSGAFGYFHSYAVGFFNAVYMTETYLEDVVCTPTVDCLENDILPTIKECYGYLNEYDENLLHVIHGDIELSKILYESYVFETFYKTE